MTKLDIQAVHRVGKKGNTIAKFVNRKFAYEGLRCGKNLKGKKLYGDQGIYINNSLCKEFGYFGFVIRKLKRKGLIEHYKIRNGVFSVKIDEHFVEISHLSDFEKYKLDIATALAD